MLGGVFNSGILATGAVAGARYNYRARAAGHPRPRARGSSGSARRTVSPLAARRAAFALGHPAVASVVLGAVTPDEVARNVAAVRRARCRPALWRDLVAEGLLRADAPVPA